MTKASDLERNPFRPGMGLKPPYLADRQYQLQRFARYLDGFPEFPRNVRVIGLRGVATPSTAIRQRPVLSDQLFSALEASCRTAASAGRRGVILCYDEAHLLRDSANQRQYPLSALLAAVARAQHEPIPVMLVVCGLPPSTSAHRTLCAR